LGFTGVAYNNKLQVNGVHKAVVSSYEINKKHALPQFSMLSMSTLFPITVQPFEMLAMHAQCTLGDVVGRTVTIA
jgi:hypothetical protein